MGRGERFASPHCFREEEVLNKAKSLSLAGALLVALFATSGCDSIVETDTRPVTNARLIISGTSPVPLLLVTSFNFGATRNVETGELQVTLIRADTLTVSLPFDRTFPFSGADRLHVRLINPDVNATASVRMQLQVDARQVFNEQANMRDASLSYTFFNFPF
jgi:hypothetical protein